MSFVIASQRNMTLTKRNGTYYVDFYDSLRNPDRKRYSLKTRNKREAKSIAERLQQAYIELKYDPWYHSPRGFILHSGKNRSTLTWSNSIDRFLESRRVVGRRESTIRTYADVLNGLQKRVSPHASPEALQPHQILDFVYDPSIAQATQSKRYGHLRTYFKWCRVELPHFSGQFQAW